MRLKNIAYSSSHWCFILCFFWFIWIFYWDGPCFRPSSSSKCLIIKLEFFLQNIILLEIFKKKKLLKGLFIINSRGKKEKKIFCNEHHRREK
jgi:hypothetical protein